MVRDREGADQRGRRARGRRVAGGRRPVVPQTWRHADVYDCSAHRPVPVVPRAGRDCSAEGPRRRGSEIARRLGRSPSTISRELRRNAATRGGKLDYRASVAQWKAELLARRPKTAKLVENARLRNYVQDRLSGQVRRPDGTPVAGPVTAPWKGRNKPRRQDRGP